MLTLAKSKKNNNEKQEKNKKKDLVPHLQVVLKKGTSKKKTDKTPPQIYLQMLMPKGFLQNKKQKRTLVTFLNQIYYGKKCLSLQIYLQILVLTYPTVQEVLPTKQEC